MQVGAAWRQSDAVACAPQKWSRARVTCDEDGDGDDYDDDGRQFSLRSASAPAKELCRRRAMIDYCLFRLRSPRPEITLSEHLQRSIVAAHDFQSQINIARQVSATVRATGRRASRTMRPLFESTRLSD